MKNIIVKFIILAAFMILSITACDSEDSFASCNLQAVAAGADYCQEISGK